MIVLLLLGSLVKTDWWSTISTSFLVLALAGRRGGLYIRPLVLLDSF
jgi:hypothetical protein